MRFKYYYNRTGGTAECGRAMPLEFAGIRLRGARVDSYTMYWNAGEDKFNETIRFSAASIKVKYVSTTQGKLGTSFFSCWNVANNTATKTSCL